MCDRAHEELDARPDAGGTGRSPTRSTPAPPPRSTPSSPTSTPASARPPRPIAAAPRTEPHMTTRIGINGFGRMGRLVVRALRHQPELELVHVNEHKGGVATAAHLLEFDTVHGRYQGAVGTDGDATRRSTVARVTFSSHDRRPATCRGPSTASTSCSSAPASSAPSSCSSRTSTRGVPQGGRRRAGEGRRGAQRRDGLQRPPLRPERAPHRHRRVVHHQLPRAGGEGAARVDRHRARCDHHDARRHQHPGGRRRAAQGPAPGPLGARTR